MLSKFAVGRPTTIVMMTLVLLLLGIISFLNIPVDLFPEIEVPVLIVLSDYEGVSPSEIEKLVTRPLEGATAAVEGLVDLQSISSEGRSLVVAQFDYGTDMDQASLKVRERVDMVEGFLPEDASAPTILRFDPSDLPILDIALTAPALSSLELQSFVEEELKPKLEQVDGVANVDIIGGVEDQVEIRFSREQLVGYGLDIAQIQQILAAENFNLPAGQVSRGNRSLSVRAIGEFQSIEEVRDLLLPLPRGGQVRLGELAQVERIAKEGTTKTLINGQVAVELSINKQSGTNTVAVSDRMEAELATLLEAYPEIEMIRILDQAEVIRLAIKAVIQDALIGAFLAVLILYIFLGNYRTTLIIAITIPVSIISTFILLFYTGITINLMTLGGLALGLGMLVDNSIVVLENIFRFRQEGYDFKEAAVRGAKEVSLSVMASTLTTIAVFLPISFVGGLTSIIFRELALTVTFSLLTSLLLALTLIPMLSSLLLTDRQMELAFTDEDQRHRLIGRIRHQFESLRLLYSRTLKRALRNRKKMVAGAVIFMVVAVFLAFFLGQEFIPEMDEGLVQVDVRLPDGAQSHETEMVLAKIVQRIQPIAEVQSLFTRVGSSGNQGMVSAAGNRGQVSVILSSLQDREIEIQVIEAEIREAVKNIPGAEVSVMVPSSTNLSTAAAPLEVKILGDDLDALQKVSDDVVRELSKLASLTEVKSDLAEGIPEVWVVPDRLIASQYGLTTAQIAQSVNQQLSGIAATRLKLGGKEVEVRLRGDSIYSENMNTLSQTPVVGFGGLSVPLGEVAEIQLKQGPISINRESQSRLISVTAQLAYGDAADAAVVAEKALASLQMPKGVRVEITGENEEIEEAFSDLGWAMLLAVVLVYMVLASEFESLLNPFIILLIVPLSYAGALYGLTLFQQTLSVPSIMGLVIITGIVVNDAIVLIDYVNIRRKQGESREEALLAAGPIRMRPILMTTLTTVLGLAPYMVGTDEASMFMRPMAVVVIFGLITSTLLTLVLSPVIYSLFDDLSIKIGSRMHRGVSSK
ncbi:efflux RND transporter permease subunit [Gottschalkiaceae bacterium SANA]|nr:efflux RND transporter permease subunit [Gottschalkiaceae bacterium SANA]